MRTLCLPRKALLAVLLTSFALRGNDIIDAFGYKWTVPNASDWKVERDADITVLRLLTPRGPLPGPRRPMQFALAETPTFQHVVVDLDVKPVGRSVMLVYAYRDNAHFDYAHLSVDRAIIEPHHNGIFHVYGGERVRISTEEGRSAFVASKQWYHVRLTYSGDAGTIQVTVNEQSVPALHAVDLSLRAGRVGVGSFDEAGEFKNIKIQGTPATAEVGVSKHSTH